MVIEDIIYHHDTASCRSDNLFMISRAMTEYMDSHSGNLPQKSETARSIFMGINKNDYFTCNVTQKSFHWLPKGLATEKGQPVLVMCPTCVHGSWFRQFSWGVVDVNGELTFVKIMKNGEVRNKDQ